jgi:hypothetical protein
MSTVRIIVKRYIQPPVDVPTVVQWMTVDVESSALAAALNPALHQNQIGVEITGGYVLPPAHKEAGE